MHKKYCISKDVISILVKNKEANVIVNGKPVANAFIKIGQIDSSEMTDAIIIQFNYILASGKNATVQNLIGETFELKISWDLLTNIPSYEKNKVLFSIKSKGTKIQVPFSANPVKSETWLNMKILNF